MKKLNTWALAIVMILTAGLTLTSCDEDNFQAEALNGQWRGWFGMYYTDYYGYEWKSDYSIIEFYQSGISSHGTGRQYDYYRHGPYSYQYFRFNWEIVNGVVYLTYPCDHSLDVCIYDYQMTSRYFSGFLGNSRATFRLDKYMDWDWNPYNSYGNYYYSYNHGYTYGGHHYDDYYGGYYYAKTRGEGNDSTDITVPMVRNGNRFNER